MMVARLMRAVAVSIAIAAAIDPPVTMTAHGHPRLALDLADAEESIPTFAREAYDRLVQDLRDDFEVVAGRDDGAAAAVFIGSRYPDAPPPEAQRVFTVTTPPPA